MEKFGLLMKNNREKHQIRFEIGIFETENTRVLKTHVREKHVCAENFALSMKNNRELPRTNNKLQRRKFKECQKLKRHIFGVHLLTFNLMILINSDALL